MCFHLIFNEYYHLMSYCTQNRLLIIVHVIKKSHFMCLTYSECLVNQGWHQVLLSIAASDQKKIAVGILLTENSI